MGVATMCDKRSLGSPGERSRTDRIPRQQRQANRLEPPLVVVDP